MKNKALVDKSARKLTTIKMTNLSDSMERAGKKTIDTFICARARLIDILPNTRAVYT